MKRIITRHKNHWLDHSFLLSSVIGALFFVFSLGVNYLAMIYVNEEAGKPAKDLLLSNLPVVNVDLVVNEGALIFIVFIALLLFVKPQRIPFTLKSAALFVLIRSIFITLTHIGTYPTHTYLDKHDILGSLNLGKDLFFSGHTGMPFLLALTYWKDKSIRNICLFTSVLFGASVILGHLHYSIDVFAAFFISYGIFHIARYFFPKDFEFLSNEEHDEKAKTKTIV